MRSLKVARTVLYVLAIAAAIATVYRNRARAPRSAEPATSPSQPIAACPPGTLLDDGLCLPVPEPPEPDPTSNEPPDQLLTP